MLSSWLQAVGGLALVWFAYVQMRGERRRHVELERTANAQLSVQASEARKALMTWIISSHEIGWGVGPKNTQEAIECVDGVRERFERGLVIASGATPPAAQRMRTAYAQLERAHLRFQAYLQQAHRAAAGPQFGNPAPPAPDQNLLSDARETLVGCCTTLAALVDKDLVAEAKKLGAWLERNP